MSFFLLWKDGRGNESTRVFLTAWVAGDKSRLKGKSVTSSYTHYCIQCVSHPRAKVNKGLLRSGGGKGWVEEGILIPRPYSSLEQHSADILVAVGLRYPHTLTSSAPVFTNSLRVGFLVTTLKGSGSDAMAGVKEGLDLYEENILYFAVWVLISD